MLCAMPWCCCRKREYKIKNLEAENGKITAKERLEGGLTQGQASTLVRPRLGGAGAPGGGGGGGILRNTMFV
jgi:hypothetical protein